MFTKKTLHYMPLVAVLFACLLAQAAEQATSTTPDVSDVEPARSTGMLYRVRVSSLHPGWVHEILPLEKTSHGKTRTVPLARADAGSYTDKTEWAAPLIIFRVLGSEEQTNDLRLVKCQGAVEVSF